LIDLIVPDSLIAKATSILSAEKHRRSTGGSRILLLSALDGSAPVAGRPQRENLNFCALRRELILNLSAPIPLRLYNFPYWSNRHFYFLTSVALAPRTERQRAQMSKKFKIMG